jgi:hypothetical protein
MVIPTRRTAKITPSITVPESQQSEHGRCPRQVSYNNSEVQTVYRNDYLVYNIRVGQNGNHMMLASD